MATKKNVSKDTSEPLLGEDAGVIADEVKEVEAVEHSAEVAEQAALPVTVAKAQVRSFLSAGRNKKAAPELFIQRKNLIVDSIADGLVEFIRGDVLVPVKNSEGKVIKHSFVQPSVTLVPAYAKAIDGDFEERLIQETAESCGEGMNFRELGELFVGEPAKKISPKYGVTTAYTTPASFIGEIFSQAAKGLVKLTRGERMPPAVSYWMSSLRTEVVRLRNMSGLEENTVFEQLVDIQSGAVQSFINSITSAVAGAYRKDTASAQEAVEGCISANELSDEIAVILKKVAAKVAKHHWFEESP